VTDLEIAFAGSPLDRADAVRADPAALAALSRPGAGGRVLKLDGLSPELDPEGGLGWEPLNGQDAGAELVFLGLDHAGLGHFAPVDPALNRHGAAFDGGLWKALGMLSAQDMALYGGARSLVDWHARHRFCAKCGAPTALAKGGWQRSCTREECRAEHFPRVDPVTIMIVEHEGRLLLGRQPRFPAGFFSALAGFVEPGESLEEAVRREVQEEAGVTVGAVRYVASQPWPFPSSLMIGCHATALTDEITVDRTELDDARWFTRAEVAAAVAGEGEAAFSPPPPRAIARQLLNWWLRQPRA